MRPRVKIMICLFLAAMISPLPGEDRYWIFFTDKSTFHKITVAEQEELMGTLLSPRALQRREIRGLITDRATVNVQDLPVADEYLEALRLAGFHIHARSRWFNAVSGYASPAVLETLSRLPFVARVEKVRRWHFQKSLTPENGTVPLEKGTIPLLAQYSYGLSSYQIQFHNIHRLHEKGLDGSGVLLAVFDTGFRLENNSLQHIGSGVVGEYDFIQMDSVTANQAGDSPDQDSHGTEVLSVLAGFLPDTLIGPAFNAQFLLAKTEIVNQELHIEEDNWAMAAEWAEALGADIVSSSVGYSEFDPGEGDYGYEDMDGQTTIITRAANELAVRGVLVVNSAGNEGSTLWKYITAPADGEYVLAVGAVSRSNKVSVFSSLGPTFDRRIKPDVVAQGESVYGATVGKGFGFYSGTSVSCPLAAGIAAQLLQKDPTLSVSDLLHVLRQSGDNAASPDNFRGWGKVDALRAWELSEGINHPLPRQVAILPVYPNPHYRSGVITFVVELTESAPIRLEIFSIRGEKVQEVYYQGIHAANRVLWDVRNQEGIPVAAGIYVYRVSASGKVFSGKLVLLD